MRKRVVRRIANQICQVINDRKVAFIEAFGKSHTRDLGRT
jgi:hypothetical protein